MTPCEICDTPTARRHRCPLCGEGSMCLACAGSPAAHYCKHAVPLRSAYQHRGRLEQGLVAHAAQVRARAASA